MSDPPAISTLTNFQIEEERQLAAKLAREMNVEDLRLARAHFADLLQDPSLSPSAKERVVIRGQTVHEEIVCREAGNKRGWWTALWSLSQCALEQIGRVPKS